MEKKLVLLFWMTGLIALGLLTASAVNDVLPGAGVKFGCAAAMFSTVISAPSWWRTLKEISDESDKP